MTQPDDWHLHLRDGEGMADIVHHSARVFGRALIMPNLQPPIASVAQALAYRQRIVAALPAHSPFQPVMALYLTEHTAPEEIAALAALRTPTAAFPPTPPVIAVKHYPAGATTHSASGVTDLRKIWPVLEAMQHAGVPLLIHGEVTAASIDVFDREACFIHHVLDPLLEALPTLKVVLEHITTQQAVEYILQGDDRLAATITAHHLLLNRNALFSGGLRPHHYCLPVLKREEHRQALLAAATSGHPRFFAGTDSAPHAQTAKESACGCAGIFTAPAALEWYAEAFDQAGALHRLEAFMAFHGADFYGVPRNTSHLTLRRTPWPMQLDFSFGAQRVIPLRAGEKVAWQVMTTGNAANGQDAS